MVEYRHCTLNPSLISFNGISQLMRVCRMMEEDGFRLIYIVPHTQYESVAVFERPEESNVTLEVE